MAKKLWQIACLNTCTGREIWNKQLILDAGGNFVEDNRRSILPYPKDAKGFTLCPFCDLILGKYQLSQCPVCETWYKGYKPYPKYHFPCPDCE